MQHEKPIRFKLTFEGEIMSQVTGSFSLVVNPSTQPPPSSLTLTPADPNGTVGQGATPAEGALPAETENLADAGDLVATISGGTAPYTVSNITGLPDGMGLFETVNADGSSSITIQGTPTAGDAADSPYEIGFTVSDSAGAVASTKKAAKKLA